jgi:Terminase large subunit, T4likevirus-type, N-terminal/Terminase RNaseH-like domain
VPSPTSLLLAERLWKWKPHSDGQRDWILCDAKVKAAACGRRWGKSESTSVDVDLYALENPGHIQIVTAPTYDQTQIIMGEVINKLLAIPGMNRCMSIRHSPYEEVYFHDGVNIWKPTQILARTAGTTGKGLRGKKAHRVIVDEAAFIKDEIIDKVIGPLLADFDGQLVLISTPDGRNHFYRAYQKGKDPNEERYASFRFPSSSNPYLPRGYLIAERKGRPERAWKQEYEAAFLDGEGAVFRRVLESMTATPQDRAIPGHQYIMSADWGRTNDYTVFVIVDLTTREMVYLDRFNQIGYEIQKTRFRALVDKFKPVSIIAEANSMGGPLVEQFQAEGLPVFAFITTNASKSTIVDDLTLALEMHSLRLLPDPVLEAELLGYEGKRLPSGLIAYSAPEKEHDDTVIATCLAAWGMAQEARAPQWYVS